MRFFLYNESKVKSFIAAEIVEYLRERFPWAEIALDELLSEEVLKKERLNALAMKFAEIRVLDAYKPFQPNEPMQGEVGFEARVLRRQASPVGVLYDGFRLQELYYELISRELRGLDCVHILFTDRFFGTYDEGDMRYHGRVILLGYPIIISLTGLVEAPAKPREFYVARRMGGNEQELRDKLKGRFIDYEDGRITEVIKGYAAQGVFYHLAGEAFCESRGCRLFNAHWQEEVLKAQLVPPEYCEKHRKMLLNNEGSF